VSDAPVRVVLDTTAVVAYTRGSVNVGEIIVEVTEEKATFAVPAICLVEAARTVADMPLRLLTVHPACRVLPLLAADWPPLAAAVRVLRRLDVIAALYAAQQADGYVLTAEPGAYGDDGGQAVIPI
jgi:hypothetical protein